MVITVITIITQSHHLHLFALSIMGWILVTSLLFITSLIKLQSVGFCCEPSFDSLDRQIL